MSQEDIQKAICAYARAYAKLEEFQHVDDPLIPPCDQKTGAIGEFYAMQYAKNRFSEDASIRYGANSQHAWDICVQNKDGEESKIQVKTVSGFSKTSTISPIHSGWDELWLLRLDEQFEPIGFWCIDDPGIVPQGEKLLGKKMPSVGNVRLGSTVFKGKAVDKLEELLNVVTSHGITKDLE